MSGTPGGRAPYLRWNKPNRCWGRVNDGEGAKSGLEGNIALYVSRRPCPSSGLGQAFVRFVRFPLIGFCAQKTNFLFRVGNWPDGKSVRGPSRSVIERPLHAGRRRSVGRRTGCDVVRASRHFRSGRIWNNFSNRRIFDVIGGVPLWRDEKSSPEPRGEPSRRAVSVLLVEINGKTIGASAYLSENSVVNIDYPDFLHSFPSCPPSPQSANRIKRASPDWSRLGS